MHTHASLHLSRLAIPLLLALGTHSVASAAVRLVAVPAKPTDLAVPHFSYNGRVTTFKAIARGFPDVAAAGAARFRWDFDGDGTWDTPLTAPRQIVTGTPDGVSAYDLGAQSMGRLRTPERGYRKKRGLGAFAGQESSRSGDSCGVARKKTAAFSVPDSTPSDSLPYSPKGSSLVAVGFARNLAHDAFARLSL